MKGEDEKYIEEIYKKMDDYEFNANDLHELINFINSQKRKDELDFKKITKDDIEWLYVYEFLLKKIEAGEKGKEHNIISHEWESLKADFDKLKATIDDVEYYDIIKSVQWSIGGGCYYNILDSTKYKQYLYGKIREIIDKFHPEIKAYQFNSNGQLLGIRPLTYEPISVPKEEIKEPLVFFRTNFKRIENPLKDTVEKLEGIITQSEIEDWIQQFDEDGEQILCLKLLSNIRFYDNKQIRHMCKTCHTKLLLDLDSETTEKIIFIPVGKTGKSGEYIIYLYKIENNLRDSQIVDHDKIDQQTNYDTIVFIDDLIGTGKQFKKFADEISLNKYNEKNIYYLSLIGFEEGIRKIETELKIKVKTAQQLTKKDLPLTEDCDLFSKEDRINAKEVLQKYGEKLYKNNSLGFQNFGALISFEHRTPNITFPIFWSNTKRWFPVFKRYSS